MDFLKVRMIEVPYCSTLFQAIRFKLNHSSTRGNNTDKEYSLWVGDLTPDVDDFALYKTFGSRYNSIKTAKGKTLRRLRVLYSLVKPYLTQVLTLKSLLYLTAY